AFDRHLEGRSGRRLEDLRAVGLELAPGLPVVQHKDGEPAARLPEFAHVSAQLRKLRGFWRGPAEIFGPGRKRLLGLRGGRVVAAQALGRVGDRRATGGFIERLARRVRGYRRDSTEDQEQAERSPVLHRGDSSGTLQRTKTVL